MQADMLRSVGIGIDIGDDTFGAKRGLHQHLRQPLELVPLLLRGIVRQRDGRPGLIHQLAAFIAGDHKPARCRAVKRLGGA